MAKRASKAPSVQTESKSPWQTIALASGTCAALNAIFAKLTTDTSTSSLSSEISSRLTPTLEPYVDIVLRILVFGISFFFTGTMWGLYTRALSLAPSAVQVNVVNTAANFVVTALLGALVFGEKLPLLWWVGAALLGAGSIVIGKREDAGGDQETKKKK